MGSGQAMMVTTTLQQIRAKTVDPAADCRAELAVTVDVLETVFEIHRPAHLVHSDGWVCVRCYDKAWPCVTAAAITEALAGLTAVGQ